MSDKTGGSAFPCARCHDDSVIKQGTPSLGEVDLRDYFAAKAIQGICSSGPDRSWTDDMLACEAYRLADAMLAQREKQE